MKQFRLHALVGELEPSGQPEVIAMPSPEIFDTLVRLASFGTSGVCILAIAIVGWSMYRIPDNHPQRHRTIRTFMLMCIVIAIISAVSGFANAYFNLEKVKSVTQEKKQIETNLTQTKSALQDSESQVAQLDQAVQVAKQEVGTLRETNVALTKKVDEANDRMVAVERKSAEFFTRLKALSETVPAGDPKIKDLITIGDSLRTVIKARP